MLFQTTCKRDSAISTKELYRDTVARLAKGDLPGAWAQAEKGLHATQESDPKQSWEFRLVQADILLWQGRPSESLTLVESSAPAGLTNDLIIQTEILQGRALAIKNDAPSARARLADAERLTAANPELLGEIKLAQGGLQYPDYESAGRDFQEALQLARKFHQPLLESKALGSLSRLSTAKGYYDQAVDLGIKSLQVATSIGAVHLETATRLNLGWAYLELGDFQQAVPLFKTCDQTATQLGMRVIRQRCVNSLGRIYFNEGQLSEANDYYNRALAGSRELGADSDTATYLDNLSLVAVELGRMDEALKDNLEALAIQRRHQDHPEELRSLLTTAIIYDARKEFGKAKPILNSIISDKNTLKEVRWEAEDELAGLDVALHQFHAARAQFEETLVALDGATVEIKNLENRLAFSLWASNFHTHYIRFLLSQRDFPGALRVAELMRARTLEEGLGARKPMELHLPALQNFLRKRGQIVFDYWLAPQTSYLWAVTPNACALFTLPGNQEIANKIERYQTSITNLGEIERGNADGQELYQVLIAPAQKLISPHAKIVIIPDGSLSKLNFETLLVPRPSPHFWIRDVQLEEASSLPLFIRSSSAPRPNPSLLVIGDPVQASPEYPRLAHARDEIQSAIGPFPEARRKIISGPQAVPSAYASSEPWKYDLIHFATHGIASDTRPLDSAIILSPDPENSFKLYARDILNTSIHAELVTISACYGAGERTYSGEGLVGLAWAFLRAGAHQVIAGLWKVDDQSTPELMKDFYAQFQGGKSAAEALRSAKLSMLGSRGVFRFPYYWASLQLYTGS